MTRLLVLGIMVVASLAGIAWTVRRIARAFRNVLRDNEPGPTRCRRCGYDLCEAPVPRCPECGALMGFKRSPEEMGIEEHELDF